MSEQNLINDGILKQLAVEYLKERKRKRRWGILFKMLFLIILVLVILALIPEHKKNPLTQNTPHVALINIEGTIFDQSDGSADSITKSIHLAYADKGTQAIILKINSPGGSPVQADYVYNEIMRYRNLKPNIKVYAVCTDMCASAAYYIASAANDIYANPSSLVGSIGVLYNGFGFVGAMQKVGVERRLLMAGKNKGFLDPFTPVSAEQQAFLQKMLDSVHEQFEAKVKQGRGDRLKITPDTFSGLVWTGTQAKDLGLIDGFGSAGYVAREVIKNNHVVNYSEQSGYLEKLAKELGVSVSSELLFKLGITQGPLVSKIQ